MTHDTQKQVLENLRRIDWLAARIRSNVPGLELTVPRLDAEQISIVAMQVIARIERETNQPTKP